MQIVLVGINHKTAGIDIRERAAFDAAAARQALDAIKTAWPAGEFVLLSTCNRVECYAAADSSLGIEPANLAQILFGLRKVDYEQIRDRVYTKTDEEAVRHLLTVASSLDSMVIGESQIIAQVKESYSLACTQHACGKILNHLFHVAFRTAKEIFSATTIANRRVSVAGVAVELAKQLFSDIRSAKIVVAGAGQMGQLLVEHFRQLKCSDITLVNRSMERGCQAAQEHGVQYGAWEDLEELLIGAHIVVGAASAREGYLFDKNKIKQIMLRRRNRMLLLIDIAVPRCFDPAIDRIDSVYLYSIDDLGQVVQDNIKLREGELEQAVEIICRNAAEFMEWLATRDIGPLVEEMKEAFEGIRDAELEEFFRGLTCPADCRGDLEFSVRSVVNKLVHCIVKNIETLAREQGSSQARRFAEGIVRQARKIVSDEKNNPQDKP
jgi:glutamyl-tRNA reductase